MNSPDSVKTTENNDAHWSKSLRVVQIVLAIWAFISLGCGILFREQLDAMLSIGGAPFGFWMAQQGAIIGFLLLLVLYMVLMNGIDKKHGFGEGDNPLSPTPHVTNSIVAEGKSAIESVRKEQA